MARILVVDDTDIVRAALVRVLTRLGHSVESTSSPLAALERLRDDPPDLPVLDYEMPVMNGAVLLQNTRCLLADRCPPALFVSGTSRDEVMSHVPEAARASFVAKPWTTAELVHAVTALLTPSRTAETSQATAAVRGAAPPQGISKRSAC